MEMKFNVRPARRTDADQVILLLEDISKFHAAFRPDIFAESVKYTKEQFEEILNDINRPVLVAADNDDRVVGYAFCAQVTYENHSVFLNRRTFYIDDFCVNEEYRGTGAAKLLMDECFVLAKNMDCDDITLNVWEFNKRAIAFYEKCGFKTQRRGMELKIKECEGEK